MELKELLYDKEALESLMRETGSAQGRNGKWNCPFHDHHDKNPSAEVSLHNGVWRVTCWSKCGGRKENYVGLKSDMEHITYTEAIKELTGEPPKAFKLSEVRNWGGMIRKHEYLNLKGEIEYVKVKHKAKGAVRWTPFLLSGGEYFFPSAIGGLVPIYNKATVAENDTLVYVEGEKDVDTMGKYGIPATTTGLGAMQFHNCDTSMLKGKVIYVWTDNDETGYKASRSVVKQLTNIGCRVYEIDPRELNIGVKGDVSDYVEFMKTQDYTESDIRQELREVLKSAIPRKTQRQKYREEVNEGQMNSYLTGLPLFDNIGFIKPRNIALIVGRGGIGKTWLTNNLHMTLRKSDIKASCLVLEDSKDFTVDRLIAQASGCKEFTDHDWCSSNPDYSEKIEKEYSHVAEIIDGYIETKASVGSDWNSIKKWLNDRYDAGDQVVIIDPITQITGYAKANELTVAFMEFFKELTERSRPMAVVLVTHPTKDYRASRDEPCTALIAQGNMLNQACKSILWYERIAEDQDIDSGVHYNAFFKVLKSSRTKAGMSPDAKWAFNFTNSAHFEDMEVQI